MGREEQRGRGRGGGASRVGVGRWAGEGRRCGAARPDPKAAEPRPHFPPSRRPRLPPGGSAAVAARRVPARCVGACLAVPLGCGWCGGGQRVRQARGALGVGISTIGAGSGPGGGRGGEGGVGVA